MFDGLDADEFEAKMARSRPGIHYPDPSPLKYFEAQHPGTLLAMTLFGEARDQGFLGCVLVAMVVRNRMFDPTRRGWLTGRHSKDAGSATVADVVLNPWAFSCFNANNSASRASMRRAHITEPEAWKMCKQAAFDVLEDRIRVDFTDGSTHYFNPKLASPKWATSPNMTRTIEYRDHLFFREEP